MSVATILLILSLSLYFILSFVILLFMYQIGESDPNDSKYKEFAFFIMLFLFGPFIVLFFLIMNFLVDTF